MFRMHIPAGTTNLGAGFDCLGLALALYNTLEIEESDTLRIELQDGDRDRIPADERNLVRRAMRRAFEAAGVPCPPVRIRPVNRIPMARGLGSSAACIVGGIAAADRMMGGMLSVDDKLAMAAAMDGHPDNAAAALLGGLTAAALDGGRVRAVRALPHRNFSFFVMIPAFELPTSAARGALPDAYSRADAVHSLTRSTLMFASLVHGCPDNLWTACDDRMHQPYRRPLVPDFDAVLAAARRCGACGAWLSGAGPSVAAAVWDEAGGFEADMRALLSPLPSRWDVRPLAVAREGVLLE